jgi:hypothetical protein
MPTMRWFRVMPYGSFARRLGAFWSSTSLAAVSSKETKLGTAGEPSICRCTRSVSAAPARSLCKLNSDGGSKLSRNKAAVHGGGAYVGADVVHVSVQEGSLWTDNEALDSGGALYVFTADFLGEASTVGLGGRAQIGGNRASRGGALYVHGFSSLELIEGANISANIAEFDGGAVFVSQLPAGLRLNSCTINSNVAARGSGGSFYIATVSHN